MSKVHYVSLYHTTMVSWGLERGFIVLLYIINVAANTIEGEQHCEACTVTPSNRSFFTPFT